MALKNKAVCVTGGAGFIGSHLVDEVLSRNPEKVIIVDNLFLGQMKNIQHNLDREIVTFEYADLTDYEKIDQILRLHSIDVIFNLAVVPLPTSLVRPGWCIDQNIKMSTVVSELLYEGAYETLVHCSSSEAYGTSSYEPMDEKHPMQPTTPYAASKAASDLIVLSYHTTFGLDTTIARPFNCYGPRQNDRRFAGLVPTTIKIILEGATPVIFGNGNQTRDYSYVTDVARGIVDLYESGKALGKEVNISSGEKRSINEIVELLIDLMGATTEIKYQPRRIADVDSHLGNNTLAKQLIKYSPQMSFEAGMKETIKYYSNKV